METGEHVGEGGQVILTGRTGVIAGQKGLAGCGSEVTGRGGKSQRASGGQEENGSGPEKK